jgi:hypothetical protein
MIVSTYTVVPSGCKPSVEDGKSLGVEQAMTSISVGLGVAADGAVSPNGKLQTRQSQHEGVWVNYSTWMKNHITYRLWAAAKYK